MEHFQTLKKLYDDNEFVRLLEESRGLTELDVNSWILIALSHTQLEDFSSALRIWKKLDAAHGANANIQYHMAGAYRGLSKYEKAINYYQKALRTDEPKIAALNDLFTCYMHLGLIDEAIALTNQFKELVVCSFLLTINYTKLFIQLPTLFIPFKSEIPKDTKFSIEFGIYQCIYRLNQLEISKFKKTYKSLADRKTSSFPVTSDKNLKNALAYFLFMGSLSEYLVESDVNSRNVLYHLGDSHSLTFTSQIVEVAGVRYVVKPDTIIGIKAWHLASDKANQWKSIFEKKINRIPEGAITFISVGEIDFRHDQGIILQPGDQISQSRNLAHKFIDRLIEVTNKKDFQIYILNIPAPVKLKSESDADVKLRIDNIKAYNEALSASAKKQGIRVIDQHTLTANRNGLSNEKFHLDEFHLKPEIMEHFIKDIKKN